VADDGQESSMQEAEEYFKRLIEEVAQAAGQKQADSLNEAWEIRQKSLEKDLVGLRKSLQELRDDLSARLDSVEQKLAGNNDDLKKKVSSLGEKLKPISANADETKRMVSADIPRKIAELDGKIAKAVDDHFNTAADNSDKLSSRMTVGFVVLGCAMLAELVAIVVLR